MEQAKERTFCGACGFPLTGNACRACGKPRGTAFQGQPPRKSARALAPSPAEYPDLQQAFQAWGQRDFPRMITHCLETIGIRVPPHTLGNGLGWQFFHQSAAVFISLDRTSGELAIESPLILASREQRTALFRSLLELNAQALGAARFCMRGDAVVLRFVDRLENIAPPKLMSAVKEVALAADHFDDLLGYRFDAQLIGPEVRKHKVPWSLLGEPTAVRLVEEAVPARMELENVAEHVSTMSRQFEAEPELETGEGALELSRTPAVRRRSAFEDLNAILKGAQALATKYAAPNEPMPLISVLTLRAAIYKARATLEEDAQPIATYLLAHLGDWVAKQPEPAAGGLLGKLSRTTAPTFAALKELVQSVIDDPSVVGTEFNGIFPVPAFESQEEAKGHVRKFMTALVRAPRDEALRVLLLEGALCEMLLRWRVPDEVVQRVLEALYDEAPPSAARAQALQGLLTRVWS